MTLPPSHLMVRVSGNDDPDTWTQVGARAAARLMSAAVASSERAPKDVLDWGCGPGRVAAHIASGCPQIALSGCDPDTEAVAWCRENIAGDFAVSGLYPPLPYADESFDAVLALSVMTHLRRRNQRQWLKELARVLRPGGVLVATVHGKAAAADFKVTSVAGIEDHYLDPFMADVLPASYYRTVLQTEAYTRAAWSDWFDIVSYEETGLERHDLVTCRRKSLFLPPGERFSELIADLEHRSGGFHYLVEGLAQFVAAHASRARPGDALGMTESVGRSRSALAHVSPHSPPTALSRCLIASSGAEFLQLALELPVLPLKLLLMAPGALFFISGGLIRAVHKRHADS